MLKPKFTDHWSRYTYYRKNNLIDEEILNGQKITLVLKNKTKVIIPMDETMRRKVVLS